MFEGQEGEDLRDPRAQWRREDSFTTTPTGWRELLTVLGLADKARTPFRKLSGGQKQRLSIARALTGNPWVAVLGELTTGLDPKAGRTPGN